jgi:spoIIIJ-associated protein
MSKTYEFQGKNVDQALQLASRELDIPVEKIKHEVVAFGSSGIFGLVGVKKAKIKVFIKENKATKQPSGAAAPEFNFESETEKQAESQPAEDKDHQKADPSLVTGGVIALQKIADGITEGAEVTVDEKRDKLCFNISGGESGVLIGKRGQTLEAIQYLLEKMINKKSTNRIRVVVDVEGYIQKRKTNLMQMASRMAEKAKRSQKPVTIGQLNAHDRRIVHIHLKDDKRIRTQSVGDGYYRKLMIFPKKKQGGSRRKHHNNSD